MLPLRHHFFELLEGATRFAAATNKRSFLTVVATLMALLFIELMLHLLHAKQMYSQPIHLTHELILCVQIIIRRVDINGVYGKKSFLAPSLESATFKSICSLLCSRTFLTGFGLLHGSPRPGPIQVASTLGDHFAAIISKPSGTQSRLSQNLFALKEQIAAICLA